jgi:hypothetical protein
LPLPKRAATNPLKARIVWKTEDEARETQAGQLYGLRFEEMDPSSQRTLKLYLDFLHRDWHSSRVDEAWRKLGARKRRYVPPGSDGTQATPNLSK